MWVHWQESRAGHVPSFASPKRTQQQSRVHVRSGRARFKRAAPDPSGLPQTTDERTTSSPMRMSTRLERVDDREEVELLDALRKRAVDPPQKTSAGRVLTAGRCITCVIGVSRQGVKRARGCAVHTNSAALPQRGENRACSVLLQQAAHQTREDAVGLGAWTDSSPYCL